MTSSSRARISASRRSRLATSTSSSSACFSSVGRRSDAGDEVAQRAGVVDVGDRDLQLLGQVRDRSTIRVNVCLHVARQRRELGRSRRRRPAARRRGRRGTAARAPSRVTRTRWAPWTSIAQRAVGHPDHARDGADDADARRGPSGAGCSSRALREATMTSMRSPPSDVVDEPDRALLPDGERRQRVGERDGLAQRQHRQHRREPAAWRPRGRPARPPPGAGPRSRARPAVAVARARTVDRHRPRRGSGRTSGSSTRRIPSR